MPEAIYKIDEIYERINVLPCAESVLFVCATCGDIWGRVHVDSSMRWLIEEAPCRQHLPTGVADSYRMPGSILPIVSGPLSAPYYAATRLEALPDILVRREFEIHLAFFQSRSYHVDQEISEGLAALEAYHSRSG